YATSRLTFCTAAPRELRQRSWDVWIHEFSAFAPLWVPARLRRRGILFFYHFVGAHALKKHPLVGGVSWASESLTLRAYADIVTISPSMQDQVRRRVSSDVNVDCVYSGVDAGYFQLDGAEEPYLLYFGRTDVHTKGLDTLIGAFASVAREHPKVRLLLAGRGRENRKR
ncbi:MAG: hypothetical protein QF563_06570, partial [Candidatus Marinimicrobia bacterium]|nr:hypothetical protein [Candidatus Neomarinimicrobiota bacterium]